MLQGQQADDAMQARILPSRGKVKSRLRFDCMEMF